jgi:hypothetical protein
MMPMRTQRENVLLAREWGIVSHPCALYIYLRAVVVVFWSRADNSVKELRNGKCSDAICSLITNATVASGHRGFGIHQMLRRNLLSPTQRQAIQLTHGPT